MGRFLKKALCYLFRIFSEPVGENLEKRDWYVLVDIWTELCMRALQNTKQGVITTTEIAENILNDYRCLSKMWLNLSLLHARECSIFLSFVITGLLVRTDIPKSHPITEVKYSYLRRNRTSSSFGEQTWTF